MGRPPALLPRGRRSLRAALLPITLALIVAEAAAGATLRLQPAAPPARAVGTVWDFRVTVEREAGEAAETPTITMVNATTGERSSASARATGDQDVYEATVVFGSRGKWSYTIASGEDRLTDSISIVDDAASGSGSGWKLLALAATALALIALAVIGLVLVRRPKSSPPAPRPAEPRPPEPLAAEPPPHVARDREALIGSYLYLYDIVRDDVLRDRLRHALAEAGVSELDSLGDRFDPALHRATGWVPTDDPSLEGRIAEVERRGFSDRGVVLRLPEVRVYSASGGPAR
jgi:molecular chaperone GrpE